MWPIGGLVATICPWIETSQVSNSDVFSQKILGTQKKHFVMDVCWNHHFCVKKKWHHPTETTAEKLVASGSSGSSGSSQKLVEIDHRTILRLEHRFALAREITITVESFLGPDGMKCSFKGGHIKQGDCWPQSTTSSFFWRKAFICSIIWMEYFPLNNFEIKIGTWRETLC